MREGGGFGVGTDVELSAGLRLDWKPFRHFGFTGGYNFLYFKLSNTLDRAGVHREADDARPSRRYRDLFLIPSSLQPPLAAVRYLPIMSRCASASGSPASRMRA